MTPIYWLYVVIACGLLLQVADAATTLNLLAAGGRENNPVVRWLIDKVGTAAGVVVAKLLVVAAFLALLVIYRSDPMVAVLVGAGLVLFYFWIVLGNLRGLREQEAINARRGTLP